MEKQKNNIIYLLIGIFALLIALLVYLNLNRPIEVKEYDVKFFVGDIPGFDLNGTALTFGRITPGGSGTRKITLSNDREHPVKIVIAISENIIDYVSVEPEIFLNSGESREIGVTILIPGDLEYGEYKGKLKMLIYRKF